MHHRRFIFLDESAVHTAMTPTHGRAPVGERLVDSAPRNYGEQTSILGALSYGRGLVATMTLTGAVDTLAFDADLVRMLRQQLRCGDMVVLDNLNVHKASQVEEVAAERSARVIWLAALLAGLLAHRAVLVKDQDMLAGGEGAHARRVGAGAGTRHRPSHEIGHLRLVQALRLLGRIRMNAAVVHGRIVLSRR